MDYPREIGQVARDKIEQILKRERVRERRHRGAAAVAELERAVQRAIDATVASRREINPATATEKLEIALHASVHADPNVRWPGRVAMEVLRPRRRGGESDEMRERRRTRENLVISAPVKETCSTPGQMAKFIHGQLRSYERGAWRFDKKKNHAADSRNSWNFTFMKHSPRGLPSEKWLRNILKKRK